MKADRAVTAGFLVAAALLMSACSVGVGASMGAAAGPAVSQEPAVGGYEGWWNSTPVSGDISGLPKETVAVRTDTGEIVDASARDENGQAAAVDPDDVEYSVVVNPAWPEQSVVIIDTETDEVIESFRVDASGTPLR
ncbi:hypothetical protein E2F48_15045 [Arthrobacter crusticola]|uniref:Lipoprotein n=1 Tax=Arthrobacter crusticola TaxID=2547960 RepID=A0A4R5TT50_9MICC|nr:hypothetical protein [Arthrobacter crusticola]TDK24092.1 hypothetical protein E2F48_15045 [Arthrobacter crusticola]